MELSPFLQNNSDINPLKSRNIRGTGSFYLRVELSPFLQNNSDINPLNTELKPICHLVALLGAHHILHVRRIRVKTVSCSLRRATVLSWIVAYWLLRVTVLHGRLRGARQSSRPGCSWPRHGSTSSVRLFTKIKKKDEYRCSGWQPGLPTASHFLLCCLRLTNRFLIQRRRSRSFPFFAWGVALLLQYVSLTL